LTTDLTSSAKPLLQIYFDRWQIEVNQVVAADSALLLASLTAFDTERGAA